MTRSSIITVAGRGKISEPSTTGTSNLDWRCFEYYQIPHSPKFEENLKNFENLKEKKINPLTSQKLARCSRPLSHGFG